MDYEDSNQEHVESPDGDPMTVDELACIVREAISQPPWRLNADKEADYADGNQLSSDLLMKQQALGIPPAKENVIGPTIAAVCGYEAKTRTDWRVTPDGAPSGAEVADALNFKLNQAERHSRADRALSQAFRAMVTVGIGWIEVARAANSQQFPMRCRYVSRNEIWWDMKSQEPDLSDAQWLFRRRWVNKRQAAKIFSDSAALIMHGSAGNWIANDPAEAMEGGYSTGLKSAADAERAWTNAEDHWYNVENKTVCITELWYRRWCNVLMLKLANGRTVEYDPDDLLHSVALQSGRGSLQYEVVARVRRSYWMGPHCLFDGPTPYTHGFFPYVPMFGYREDMTGIPYGLVRDMIFPQDNLNSSIAKLRWGMSATRTERTKGAVAMTDDQFRRMAARSDADVILNQEHMAKPGARFEVKRDFQLNGQQFQLMNDSRMAMQRVSGVSTAFMGQQGTASSGLQEQTQLEQSQVSQADLMDQFKEARMMVGELLMAMIIEDMGDKQQTVEIEGDAIRPARKVVLNKPETDEVTEVPYLSNDIQRARLKVALEDVPSTSGFRAQQLNSLSESIKAMPPPLQKAAFPFMVDLMDLPKKKEVVDAVIKASSESSPEQMREQIKQELMHDLKEREVANRERLTDAQIKQLMAQAVQTGVQAAFAAMQGGAQVAQMPMIAPIADEIMRGAGYQRPTPEGDDPNFPTPSQAAAMNIASPYIQGQGAAEQAAQAPPVHQNTSPEFPPRAATAERGMNGIETARTADNLPH